MTNGPVSAFASVLEEIPPPLTPVDGVRGALARRRERSVGPLYAILRWSGAIVLASVIVALVVSLLASSREAFVHSGVSFFWSGTWDPVRGVYGAGVFVVGTLVTTAEALVLAVPVGILTAAFLSELAPRPLAAPLTVAIDLIAAIPSVVVGLWGLLVLGPLFGHHVEPVLKDVPGLSWLTHGRPLGADILLAGVVLAVMILPTIVALSRVAMRAVDAADREAARALGGTKWQVVHTAVVPGARNGIEAAVTLAMGRALGEAIAVAMVIGNVPAIPHSLLAPGATIGSKIVNEFAAATSSLDRSEVVALVVVLLAITSLVNIGGYLLLRSRRQRTELCT